MHIVRMKNAMAMVPATLTSDPVCATEDMVDQTVLNEDVPCPAEILLRHCWSVMAKADVTSKQVAVCATARCIMGMLVTCGTVLSMHP